MTAALSHLYATSIARNFKKCQVVFEKYFFGLIATVILCWFGIPAKVCFD
jgi:hypothetical protein